MFFTALAKGRYLEALAIEELVVHRGPSPVPGRINSRTEFRLA